MPKRIQTLGSKYKTIFLPAIYDCGEMLNLSVYLYDDAGERVWKLIENRLQM